MDDTPRIAPPSLHSYNAPTIDHVRPDNDIIAILHTGPQTLVIKGPTPDANVRPLWAADAAHIKAICALMYTSLNDSAIHSIHTAVVRRMMEHMGKRADDTMVTIRALNTALAELQSSLAETQHALNATLAKSQHTVAELQRALTESQHTAAELRRDLAESQRARVTLSARVVELETSSDAQFDWAEM